MAVIVTRGKVDGKPAGSRIDGLTKAQERRLVDLGVAEYCDDENHADKGMTVKELKELCKELGLQTSGKKEELEARIAEFEAAKAYEGSDDENDDDSSDSSENEGREDDEGGDDDPPVLTAEVPR